MFWWDRVSLLLHRTKEKEIELDFPKRIRVRVADARSPLLNIIKRSKI